jgi:hypothetical protein
VEHYLNCIFGAESEHCNRPIRAPPRSTENWAYDLPILTLSGLECLAIFLLYAVCTLTSYETNRNWHRKIKNLSVYNV